ncbi:MAG: TPM domain-containing protein [Xanthomonadaceae bacterium]|nr:TPM domain-containing protein [Xanthomonadaceae bacterium]
MHWTRQLAALCLLWLASAVALAQQVAPIPPLDSPVIDTTGTLDAASREQLIRQAEALQQRKGSQLQVLIVPTTEPEDIAQYAQRVYDQWKLGRKGVDDGVILIVAKDDRRVRIQPGYGLEGAIPDATASRVIQEYLVPKFRNGDFAGGVTDATEQLVRLIDGEQLPAPIADHSAERLLKGGNWLLALFGAFIAATVLRNLFGGMRTGFRSLLVALGSGGVAWLMSSVIVVGGIGAFIGFFMGLAGTGAGRFARDDSWGGWGGGGGMGGWGGGSGGSSGGSWGGGSSGGGGWSGGGGMSGGGGASGSW